MMFLNTHFSNAKKYWHMGKFYDWSQAISHPMSHALHYGTSVFEGIRSYKTDKGPAIFRLPEHVDRFFHSAAVAKMTSPYTREEIIRVIKLTLKKNKLEAAYIRPLLFYAYGNLGLVPKYCPVELLIGTWEWGAYLGEKAARGVSVYIVPWRRVHHSQLDMTAKLGGVYVQSTICGLEARSRGFDEALFMNLEGNIAEGPGENIFVVKNKVLHTNDKTESVLEGITRTSLLQVAKDLGMKATVAPVTKQDLFNADEVFFTGTAVEVVPVVRITDGSNPRRKKECVVGDGKPGKITRELGSIYKDIVGGRVAKYKKWLTYVD